MIKLLETTIKMPCLAAIVAFISVKRKVMSYLCEILVFISFSSSESNDKTICLG